MKKVTFLLPEELYEWLREYAFKARKSQSYFVSESIKLFKRYSRQFNDPSEMAMLIEIKKKKKK